MKNKLDKFYEELDKTRSKAKEDVENIYKELTNFVDTLDPIKLLSQLVLTFLFVPEDKFIGENSETVKWSRKIEFLTGYLITKEYPKNPKLEIEGNDLRKIEALLDSYFNKIPLTLLSKNRSITESDEIESILNNTKIHSLYVRGVAYPHQLREAARSMYTLHDDWFVVNHGFTINDVIDISKSITNEYNRRVNEHNSKSREQAKIIVEQLIIDGELNAKGKAEAEINVGCHLIFSSSDAVLSFTEDELVQFSGIKSEICRRYLERMSQPFGYRNIQHKDVYMYPLSAPWDYNTLYEKPIIKYADKYFAPLTSLFDEVIMQTFYYDLIGDDNYWMTKGEKKHGAWLEQTTGDYLKKVFPQNEVIINPKYPDGNELCDVLVLHDRKIFIVECKTKRMRFAAKIGKDYQLIKDDLNKFIKTSFEQALHASEYFKSAKHIKIKTDNIYRIVDTSQVTEIFLLSVTLGDYQNLITRLANINPVLKLITHNEYPWAVSIFDLYAVTEIIEYPSMMVHYVRKRIASEKQKFKINADEMDFLGYYVLNNLSFDNEQFKNIDYLDLSGFSEDIDKYMFNKHERDKNILKPKYVAPDGFECYIKAIEGMVMAFKTDCLIKLLDLNTKYKKAFIDLAEISKTKTLKDNRIHDYSFIFNGVGYSFIAMNCDGNKENIFKNVCSFIMLKKYRSKCKEWVGVGWDKSTENILDIAVYLSYEWIEDKKAEDLAKIFLKPGTETNY